MLSFALKNICLDCSSVHLNKMLRLVKSKQHSASLYYFHYECNCCYIVSVYVMLSKFFYTEIFFTDRHVQENIMEKLEHLIQLFIL